jgi:hypothetical protein
MKITKRQLRKLIEESFVVDPKGTVYTPGTVKSASPYKPPIPDKPDTMMDVPARYGLDDIKLVTPKLYEFLSNNWQKIFNMHKKGSQIFMMLADRETDPETKIQLLHLVYTEDILTEEEYKDIELEFGLLFSPDFQDFRDQSKERLKRAHEEEVFADNRKKIELSTHPKFVAWAKKQIDKAVEGGYEYFKDGVKEQFYYDMYDLKAKGFPPSYIGYNPDEGVEPAVFADNNSGRIQERLGSYSVTDKLDDASFYNDDLYDYNEEKSIDLILVVINDLVDAGILESTPDGKVRMSERSYQIELNNQRGRKEDFYKQRGTRSAFLDDPYEPNPNLPVVTKEGKMKITRRQLRKLIIEGLINETKRYISNPDGSLTPADDAYASAAKKDMHTANVHPNIAKLVQSSNIPSRVQGRELADAIEDIDRLTPEEETAIDHMGHARATQQDPIGTGLEYQIDKEALYGAMKSKSKSILKRFGFSYVKDVPHLDPKNDYGDYGDMFRFQAQVLGCNVEDLAWVQNSTVMNENSNKTYEMLIDMSKQMGSNIPILGDDPGYYGLHNELKDIGGLRVLFDDDGYGYKTATICGK